MSIFLLNKANDDMKQSDCLLISVRMSVDWNNSYRVATKIIQRFSGRAADTGSMILLLLLGLNDWPIYMALCS